jgi:hypothetical protein
MLAQAELSVRGESRVRLDSSLTYIGAPGPNRVKEVHFFCELSTAFRSLFIVLRRSEGRGW